MIPSLAFCTAKIVTYYINFVHIHRLVYAIQKKTPLGRLLCVIRIEALVWVLSGLPDTQESRRREVPQRPKIQERGQVSKHPLQEEGGRKRLPHLCRPRKGLPQQPRREMSASQPPLKTGTRSPCTWRPPPYGCQFPSCAHSRQRA